MERRERVFANGSDDAFDVAARETGRGAARKNGAKNGGLSPAQEREDELLRRIAMLEAQLE